MRARLVGVVFIQKEKKICYKLLGRKQRRDVSTLTLNDDDDKLITVEWATNFGATRRRRQHEIDLLKYLRHTHIHTSVSILKRAGLFVVVVVSRAGLSNCW